MMFIKLRCHKYVIALFFKGSRIAEPLGTPSQIGYVKDLHDTAPSFCEISKGSGFSERIEADFIWFFTWSQRLLEAAAAAFFEGSQLMWLPLRVRPPNLTTAFFISKINSGTLFFSCSNGRRVYPKKVLAKGEGPHPPSLMPPASLQRATSADDGLELNAGLSRVPATAAVTGYEVICFDGLEHPIRE